MRRLQFEFWNWLGWLLCELAFKTGCRGPFAYAYCAGSWCYGRADDFDADKRRSDYGDRGCGANN
jgi:hypothetical protein